MPSSFFSLRLKSKHFRTDCASSNLGIDASPDFLSNFPHGHIVSKSPKMSQFTKSNYEKVFWGAIYLHCDCGVLLYSVQSLLVLKRSSALVHITFIFLRKYLK